MPRRRSFAPPKYRHFRPRNSAVVRIDGRDRYLGPYGSPESLEAYRKLLAEHAFSVCAPEPSPVVQAPTASPTVAASAARPLTVDELLNAYRKFAREYYAVGGKPGAEYVEMGYVAASLRKQLRRLPASEFGPSKLKAVQRQLVEEDKLCRRGINRRINRIKRIFKWGVSEELIPPNVHQGLLTVSPLKYGRRLRPSRRCVRRLVPHPRNPCP